MIHARDVCIFAMMIRPAKCLNYLQTGFIAQAIWTDVIKYNVHGS